MRFVRTIGLIAADTLLVVCVMVMLGAQFFGLPLVSPFGSTVLSVFGPWLVVVPMAIGLIEFGTWRTSRSRVALTLMSVAVVTTAWAAVALARMVTAFSEHGVHVNLLRAFQLNVLPPWRPDDDVLYGTWHDEALHVLVYKPESRAAAAPIMLYIHGGGFSVGDRFENGTNLRWFADRGWLVLSIDYTLSSADRHLWDVTTSQVGCAMVWAAANASRLGGDPARLSLVGSSAGGNLAINAAYLANAGRLQSSCEGNVPRVSAVSALYPPVDLAAAWVSQVPFISDMARKFNTYYLGGAPRQFPERYQFVGSAAHIDAAAPPTLVIFGAHDHLVPPAATDRFVQQARDARIDIESVRVPYGEHAFNLNQHGIGNQLFLGLTEKFLREHDQPAGASPMPGEPH